MGFFGKDRHGTMEVVTPGLEYRWRIPNFFAFKGKVLDSENVPSFEKTMFHFHMVISEAGDIGFYMHYKAIPIPKYSYCFTSSTGEKLRQHTAHTIPADTERCGHWNVTSMEDVATILTPQDQTLVVLMSFDDDTVTMSGSKDIKIDWTIPRALSRNLEPLCSKSFDIDGMTIVARADYRPSTDECHFFLFNRKASQPVPPHTIVCTSADGTVMGVHERSAELGAQILKIPMQSIRDACATLQSLLVVTIIVSSSANPLDILNIGRQPGGNRDTLTRPGVAPPRVVTIGEKSGGKNSYVVVNDDDV